MLLKPKGIFRSIFCARFSIPHVRHQSSALPVTDRTGGNDGPDSSKVRVRFAPSPTGDLHLGGLRTALYNFLFSRSMGGKFILRIEDTDQERLVAGATERLIEALQWAGIEIDEGPLQGGDYGPYIQSKRLEFYHSAIEKLLENGMAYRCFCSERRLDLMRREMRGRGEVPRYDNRCRHLDQSEISEKLVQRVPYVVRFKLDSYTEPWTDLVYGPIVYDVANIEGDPVLMKSDGYPTYHFANVVDDHYMKVTHVLRGLEWQVSTTKHILLYRALGWSQPQFAHLPLLQNKDGKKLSKRQNDITVNHYRKTGYFPDAVLNLLTSTGSGFKIRDTAGLNLSELVQHFDLRKMNTNSTRVDFDKLPEFNRLHLKRLIAANKVWSSNAVNASNEVKSCNEVNAACNEVGLSKNSLLKQVRALLSKEFSEVSRPSEQWSEDQIMRTLDWASDRITMLPDLLGAEFRFVWAEPDPEQCSRVCLSRHPDSASLSNVIQSALSKFQLLNNEEFEREKITAMLADQPLEAEKEINSELRKLKYSQRMQLLRIAVTGKKEGPSVAEIFSVLGKDKVLLRLQKTLENIQKSSDGDNTVIESNINQNQSHNQLTTETIPHKKEAESRR